MTKLKSSLERKRFVLITYNRYTSKIIEQFENITRDGKAEREQSLKIAHDLEKNPLKVNVRKAIKQNQYAVRAKTVRK